MSDVIYLSEENALIEIKTSALAIDTEIRADPWDERDLISTCETERLIRCRARANRIAMDLDYIISQRMRKELESMKI